MTTRLLLCVLQIFGAQKEMDALKKELEEELKLSTEDLQSHAWYHGPVGREVLYTTLMKHAVTLPVDFVPYD